MASNGHNKKHINSFVSFLYAVRSPNGLDCAMPAFYTIVWHQMIAIMTQVNK
jgi:hypothetical protein